MGFHKVFKGNHCKTGLRHPDQLNLEANGTSPAKGRSSDYSPRRGNNPHLTKHQKHIQMKKILITVALALTTTALLAASLTPVEVGAPAIDCLYNPACTSLVTESSSPITLPGATGTGFLQTRIVRGETGAPAAGLFGYEYRIDLSGMTLGTNTQPCFTNLLQCTTNRVEIVTNAVVCTTNGMAVSNLVICVTNRVPATNIVVCVTNSLPGTNFQHCFTNAQGAVTCFTNDFPATDNVRCATNRIPARTFVACQTNVFVNTNVLVTCHTNRVRYFTNLVTCVTNQVSCPGSTPCIQELRIDFGPIVSRLDFDTNGSSTDQVYVVTSGALGTISPAQITHTNRQVVLQFSPPICPGDSTFFVGLLSASPPRAVSAKLGLTDGSNLVAAAQAPQVARLANCGFNALADSINGLGSHDILGPNAQARESHRNALLRQVKAASLAAKAGNLDDVLTALAGIMVHVDGGNNDWVTAKAAGPINAVLADLIACLEQNSAGSHHDHDGDKDDDDDRDDRDGHNH